MQAQLINILVVIINSTTILCGTGGIKYQTGSISIKHYLWTPPLIYLIFKNLRGKSTELNNDDDEGRSGGGVGGGGGGGYGGDVMGCHIDNKIYYQDALGKWWFV